MNLRPLSFLQATLLSLLLTACAEPAVTIDETITGVEVSFTYDSALALDQVEVAGWTQDRQAAFEAFLLPEEPVPFTGTEQSFALLLADELDGQSVRLELIGISSGESVAAGQGTVVVAQGELTALQIALEPDALCELDADHDGICDTEDPCIDLDNDGLGMAGTDLTGCAANLSDVDDNDESRCADSDEDTCDDCSQGRYAPNGDGADGDADGICDQGDSCTDLDQDGFGTGTLDNIDCPHPEIDVDDSEPTRCIDLDEDSCDDCSQGSYDPSSDGTDQDSDGVCDAGDTCTDIDGDGIGSVGLDTSGCIAQVEDTNDYDPTLCSDTDADGCDDCIQGSYDPTADGDDTDSDGICNRSDTCTDVDGDGLGDGTLDNAGCVTGLTDIAQDDPFRCGDVDSDSCDDCSSGNWNIANDGEDGDSDGTCDSTDLCTDQDNDGLGTGTNANLGCLSSITDDDDNNPFVCADSDFDNCNDCAVGSFEPSDDGLDADNDGLCDLGDTCTDVDGDGIGNGTLENSGCITAAIDSNDTVATSCLDQDSDGCDDCSNGSFDPSSDGSDLDDDGICDYTDRCIDLDSDGFGNGSLGNETCPQSLTDIDDGNANRCVDTDQDSCDDCSSGSFSPSSDGADGDQDGTCDLSDRCTDLDGDGLGNGNLGNTDCVTTLIDTNDSVDGASECFDSDEDGCDDCSVTNFWTPEQDGADGDNDGACDLGDTCTDYDGDGFGSGTLSNSGCAYPQTDTNDYLSTACADLDADTCDDCTNGSFDITDDGSDADSDGLCDSGDTCTDYDGDGIGNGSQGNTGCVYPFTDSNDHLATQCGDSDFDTCDDCAEGYFLPQSDGIDLDFDGLCDAGDPCVDVDHDGICSDDDCDDSNPYCNSDCSDQDGDSFCANWDCNDGVWSCGLDCTTNSDGHAEAIPMVDCMEIFCGSDPQDPSSSCIMPTTGDELADAINSLGSGETHIIVGDVEVEDNLPAIDHDGTVTITQEPGTAIVTSADQLFTIRGDDNHIEGLLIEVEDAKTVIDIEGDNNSVVGVAMLTTGEQPDKAIDVSGANNKIIDNYIAGFDDRGIAIDGNSADGNLVQGNVITGGVDFASNDKAGIFIRNAENTLIIGNVVAQNNMDGIALQKAQETMIVHNTIASNANGLVFAGWGNNRRSIDTCARNNLITDHDWGAGIVSRSGTSWDESSNCLSTEGYGNNSHENAYQCDLSSCFGCSCLPSDDWWQYDYSPNYVSTTRGSPGYYCLEDSQLEGLGRDLGYDLNGSQPGNYNGSSPEIGGRETGSAQCQ